MTDRGGWPAIARRGILASLAMMVTVLATGAHAEDHPVLLGTWSDWTAYTLGQGRTLVCFALANPRKTQPPKLKRDDPHLMISHRPGDKQFNVFSATLGYTVPHYGTASLHLGKTDFPLFTDRGAAWAPDSDSDKAVVEAMARAAGADQAGGAKSGPATLTAHTQQSVETRDSYELDGFAQALGQIDKACKVKR